MTSRGRLKEGEVQMDKKKLQEDLVCFAKAARKLRESVDKRKLRSQKPKPKENRFKLLSASS